MRTVPCVPRAVPRDRRRYVGVGSPGRGGRRLHPPCWMPQIRHNLSGSFPKKIKIKSEVSSGCPTFSLSPGGSREEPEAFFFLRRGGVAMETRTAGERGWGLGRGGVGAGRGAARETARGVQWGGRAQTRAGGGIHGRAERRRRSVLRPTFGSWLDPAAGKKKKGGGGEQARGAPCAPGEQFPGLWAVPGRPPAAIRGRLAA